MRLILDLAIHAQDGPVSLNDVANRQNISHKYLEKLSTKLKAAGYIRGQRGPFGGHELAVEPREVSAGDIVRALEERTAITECAEKPDGVCGVCQRAGDCLTRWIWIEASRAMFARLDAITLDMLVNAPEEFIAGARKSN